MLRIVSNSPGEAEPVFQAILKNGTRICEANFGILLRYEEHGFRPVAMLGVPPPLADMCARTECFGRLPKARWIYWFARKGLSVSMIFLMEHASNLTARLGGARSYLAVPMLQEDELIGVMAIYRQEVRPFADEQIELVQKLRRSRPPLPSRIPAYSPSCGNPWKRRFADLRGAEGQIGFTFDLQTVLDTLTESAARLCEAEDGGPLRRAKDLVFYLWPRAMAFSAEI